MHSTHRIIELFKYAIKGKSRFYLHSPFVYEFAENVLQDKRHFYAFDDIEALKNKLLLNHKQLEVTDFGERQKQSNLRKVSDIAQKTSIAPRYGKLLFRLVNHFKPQNMLELGTSLGISTLYQSKGNEQVKLITMEGCPSIAKVAAENFEILKAEEISIEIGNFNDRLGVILKNIEKLDYVFIDGNHQKEATLRYFKQCLAKAHDQSIFVFDDIHWSPDMTEAWNLIIKDPKVSISLDFYQLGILFFRQGQAKENFKLWYW